MKDNLKNNRSILALSGEHSLNLPIASKYQSKKVPQNKYRQIIDRNTKSQPQEIIQNYQEPYDLKKIIKKLTLHRLRKMQALVRGFLVRRQVYPKELESYLAAKSILDLITKNVIYKQSSQLVIEAITFSKYQGDSQIQGEQRIIEEFIYNKIIQNIIEKEFKNIAKQAITEKGLLMSRPQITFGMNIRDPLELLLYEKVMSEIKRQAKQISEEGIHDHAIQVLQLRVMQDWMEKMSFLQEIYEDIIHQTMAQNIAEYVEQRIISRIIKEGAMIVSKVVYEGQLEQIQQQKIEQLTKGAEQWLLSQVIGDMMVHHHFGIIQDQDQPSKQSKSYQ